MNWKKFLMWTVAAVLVGALVGTLTGICIRWSLATIFVAPLVISALVYLFFCFTYVKEGTAKNVVRFGGYRKTLLAKKGYKLNPYGDVEQLDIGEKPQYPAFMGGLRWVSLLKPLGIDRIYTRTMKYVKALSDGTFERRADENTDFVLAGTQFQYGLEFSSAEDSAKLPLSGKMTMTAMIVSPYRALFLVREWFDALVGRVLPRVRQYISEHAYDKIINDPGTQLDKDVFKLLQEPDDTDSPLRRSIIQILRQEYGIELVALETVNVDPPEGYREATLAKWKAQQTADKDVEETAGRILKSVAMSAHISVKELKAKLKKNDKLRGISNAQGGFKEDFDKAWDQVKRDRAGAGLRDVRVGNADGTNLDPVTAWAASLISLAKGADRGSSSGNPGGQENQGGDKGQGGGKDYQRKLKRLDDLAQKIKDQLDEDQEEEEEEDED